MFILVVSTIPFRYQPSNVVSASSNKEQKTDLQGTTGPSTLQVPGSIILPIGLGSIWDLVWSPDGKNIVVVTDTGFYLFDRDHVCLETCWSKWNQDNSPNSAAFSPDSKQLLLGERRGAIKLWDITSDNQPTVLEDYKTPPGGTFVVAFSPDGKRLAFNDPNHIIQVWDVASGKATMVLGQHTDFIKSFVFSPDGTRLASNGEPIRLWDVTSGAQITVLTPQSDDGTASFGAWNITFSPDGKQLVAAGGDGNLYSIRSWDVSSGNQLETIPWQKSIKDEIYTVVFSPNGKWIAIGGDKTVELWDASSGNQVAVLKGHISRVRAVAFSPDSTRLISGDDQGLVWMWDLSQLK